MWTVESSSQKGGSMICLYLFDFADGGKVLQDVPDKGTSEAIKGTVLVLVSSVLRASKTADEL